MGLKKNNPGCGCCDEVCDVCDESTLSVTLDGFVDGFCNNCDEDLNATFVLDYSPNFPGHCRWNYAQAVFCTFRDLDITLIIAQSGPDWLMSVTVGSNSSYWQFQKNYGATPPDCAATDTLPLTLSDELLGVACQDGGSASCQVN